MEDGTFKFSILSKFPEITQAVSKRAYGNMKKGWGSSQEVTKNRKHFFLDLKIEPKKVVISEIVHGNKIAKVSKKDLGKTIFGVDGLLTTEKGIFLMVTIADCLPIFAYDPINQVVGLAHAGWRGIIDKICSSLIREFKNAGTNPNNLIVGIGPGICQKHFVIKNDVLRLFKDDYPQATLVRNHDGYVDLRKAIVKDLQELGVSRHNIEISHDCPTCLNGIYGSYRKEGENAPAAASIIGMR